MSADWLATHLDDPRVRIVELDVSPKSYAEGHIPGAVLGTFHRRPKDRSYRLVDRTDFERILSTSGITPEAKVVFYGYGAVLGYWLLQLYRHPNAAVLNLSKQRWQEAGMPWTTEQPEVNATRYPLLDPDGDLRAPQPMVTAAIGANDWVLLDVRSDAEFRGERFWPSGAPAENGRAGHIPGAIPIAPDAFLNADGSFAPAEVLRGTFFPALGDVPNVITYCTIGNRASIAWFVLTKLLGRSGVRVYEGSWAEWGFLPGVPVVTASG